MSSVNGAHLLPGFAEPGKSLRTDSKPEKKHPEQKLNTGKYEGNNGRHLGDRVELSGKENVPANRPADEAIQRPKASGIGLLMGQVNLELSYASMSSNGNQSTMHQEYLKLDFSFLEISIGKNLDNMERHQDLVDSGVMKDFTEATMQLDFLDDSSLKEYNTAVDNLFTQLEETLKLGDTGLDHVQGVFKNQVASFFDRVQDDETKPAMTELDGLKTHLLKESGRLMDFIGEFEQAQEMFLQAFGLEVDEAVMENFREVLTQLNELVNRNEDDSIDPGKLNKKLEIPLNKFEIPLESLVSIAEGGMAGTATEIE